ncbi:DNA repair protein RAD51 homolog 4 isoform X5 [Gallus gallus]|uniref:DNA repair protein RAD51 homolog 4 isoform X5 n=1 Tax=Gallus gallus TaxID=9031 RepID=UPI001AE561AA|nr:DNA repair protein RAD51 homolog 4 isoform X5 [Gallus gallus]
MAAGVVWVALKGHPLGVTRHHCSVGGPMGMLRAVCPHGPPWYPRVRYGTPWVPIPSPHRSLRFHPRSAPSHSAGAMVVLRAGLCPGLTEEMIQLLRANNIRTVVDFVSSDLEDVAQSCSLSYKLGPAAGCGAVHWGGDGAGRSTGQRKDTGVPQHCGQRVPRPQAARLLPRLHRGVHCLPTLPDAPGPGGGQGGAGLAIMMQLARELKTLAKEFSVAVVVTNQVTRDSSTGALKSALGRSWSFVPSTRVLLQGRAVPWEEGAAPHTACLAKSPRQPTGMQVQLDIGSDAVQEQRPVTPTP